MAVVIARKGILPAEKHCLNAYPLEGYGFLLDNGAFVCAALPVGLREEHESMAVFPLLEKALPALGRLLSGTKLALCGIYHSISDSREGQYLDVPVVFSHLFVYEIPTDGGESLWDHTLYRMNSKGAWLSEDFVRIKIYPKDPEINPRRIRSRWRELWDYEGTYGMQPRVYIRNRLKVDKDWGSSGLWVKIADGGWANTAYAMYNLPEWLVARFDYWSEMFECCTPWDMKDKLDWDMFNAYGLSLAMDLKRVLGKDYNIYYDGRDEEIL